jgi:hypothetical protein
MKKNATAAALVASALAAALSISAAAPAALADEWGYDQYDQGFYDQYDLAEPDYPDPVNVPDPLGVPDDGIVYGVEYDLLVPVAVPYFDLTPCNGIVLDYLYAPTNTYVIPARTASLIAQRVCRVPDASLVSTSASLFVHDAHGLCWSVEVRQAVGGGCQRVFYVTIDAVTGQAYSVKVVR